jgi:hypothetical protein
LRKNSGYADSGSNVPVVQLFPGSKWMAEFRRLRKLNAEIMKYKENQSDEPL